MNAEQLDLPAAPPTDPAAPIPEAVSLLVDYIFHNAPGPANAVTAAHLARILHIGPPDGRHVRRLLSLYIEHVPHLIVGSPGQGYFLATDPAEQCTHKRRQLYAQLQALALQIRNLDRLCSRHGLSKTSAGPSAFYTDAPPPDLYTGPHPDGICPRCRRTDQIIRSTLFSDYRRCAACHFNFIVSHPSPSSHSPTPTQKGPNP